MCVGHMDRIFFLCWLVKLLWRFEPYCLSIYVCLDLMLIYHVWMML
jgi:hypothetical protein